MSLYPQGSKLDEFEGRYVLVNLAARRATQLTRDKAPTLVQTDEPHALTIALEEIAAGAVVAVYEIVEKTHEPLDTLDSIDLAGAKAGGIDSLISELLGGGDRSQPQLDEAVTEMSLDDALDQVSFSSIDDEEISLEEFGGTTLVVEEEMAGFGQIENGETLV